MSATCALSVPGTGLRLWAVKNRANDRLLFGRPAESHEVPERGILHLFEPGQVFGFVRWRGDGYGTQTWRVVVAEALPVGASGTAIPGIEPGADLLLHAYGKTFAKRALRAIDLLSRSHVLHEIAPAYWRHLHLCVGANVTPDPYEDEAFRLRAEARLPI